MLFPNKKREYTYTYVISSDWAGRARFRLESCAGSRLKSALEVRQNTPAGAQSKRSLEMGELKYEVSSFDWRSRKELEMYQKAYVGGSRSKELRQFTI